MSREHEMPVLNVNLHRWDTRARRYRAVKEELSIPEIICVKWPHKDCHATHEADKATGLKVLEMRNQQVDSIHLDPATGTIEIFCSPRLSREWKRKKTEAAMAFYTPLDSNLNK